MPDLTLTRPRRLDSSQSICRESTSASVEYQDTAASHNVVHHVAQRLEFVGVEAGEELQRGK